MTDAPFRSTRAHKRDVSADGEAGLVRTMVGLWPHIWPRDRRDLSLRFHLERKTGGLTRVLERGRNAIETIVRMVIMQLVPTALELSLIVAVLLYQFDWRYVVVILITVACYMLFTYFATEWRINIRRRMNDSDTDANVKAIDSLLNYETVKYFVAEEREAARYDLAMERYEKASVEAYVPLAVLNGG